MLIFAKAKNVLFFGFRFKVLDTKTFKNTVFFTCFLVYVFKNCKKPPVKKNKKKQYSRTLAKVKMQKSKKTSRKPKKTKKTIFQKSGDRVNRQEVLEYCFFFVFFVFFGFLEVFWIFAFLLLQESWNIVFFFSSFFCFFWFSRGFLEIWRSQKKKAGFLGILQN